MQRGYKTIMFYNLFFLHKTEGKKKARFLSGLFYLSSFSTTGRHNFLLNCHRRLFYHLR
jgi:hypothetical protein